jgi:hypothetical protein
MKQALEKWLDPESDASAGAPKDDFLESMNNPASIKTAKTATKVEDISSAFDELFKK